MAEIRKIVRSSPLSAFTQVAPAAGGAFAVLADVANQAYQALEPLADAEMARRGEEDNRELARQQVGSNTIPVAPPAPSGPDLSTIAPVPQGFSVEGASAAIDRADGQMTGGGGAAAAAGGEAGDRLGSPLPASLVRTESGGNIRALNSEGYGGRGQFGAERLSEAFRAGAIDRPMTGAEFSRQPESVQAAVERWHVGDINSFIRQRGLDRFVGQTIKGVEVTPNGMIAVAHLGGKGGLQKFLESGGSYNPADSNGTSLLGYLGTHQGGAMTGSAGTPVMAGSGGSDTLAPAAAAPPPTMVRTSQGKLEPRLYNPAGGRFAQIYNAAAQMTFLSESMLAGQADMMNLSAQMPMDPDGFMQQARAYVDQTVANADPMLRPDLRANLETEMQRRYLGMVDERNDDIRRRSENSSSALIDRWSGNYVEALAAGNTAEAQTARTQLESVLYARESLPGVSWTREQSVNVLLQADRQSRRVQADRATAQASEWKDGFEASIAARSKSMIGGSEYLLDNPAAVAAHPDLAEELASWIEFETAMPGFRAGTPAQQKAAVAEMRAVPVQDRYQITMADKAAEVAAASEKAWNDDAVGYADQLSRVSDFPPPPTLPAFDPANPGAFTSALQARRDYGLGLQAQGYTKTPVFLSKAEAEQVSTVMGKDVPPELRLAAASAIVAGFGPSAVSVFQQMDIDPVLRHGASLMAVGASETAAVEALRGQQMMDEGLVSVPARLSSIDSVDPSITAALTGIAASEIGMTAEVMNFATAIYASRARGVDPESESAQTMMADAIQTALGQEKTGGMFGYNERITGGVQTVAGHPVWLPVGMAGEDMDKAITALNRTLPGEGFRSRMFSVGQVGSRPDAEMWRQVVPEGMDASVPYLGNAPMDRSRIQNGQVRLVPTRLENGTTAYRMEVATSASVLDVATESGALFYIDAQKLMEMGQ